MKEIGAGAFMEKAIGIGTSLGQVLNKSLTFFYKWGAYSKLQTAIDTYNQARAGGGNHDQAMDDVKQLLTMRDSGGMIKALGLPDQRLERALRETFEKKRR